MTIDELKALQEKLWQEHISPGRYGRIWYSEARKVTFPEWESIKLAIKEHQLAVHMVNACMGFGCGIELYQPPQYPGLPAEYLIKITTGHFDMTFGEMWDGFFYPLASTDRNAELLEICGLQQLRSRVYYEY